VKKTKDRPSSFRIKDLLKQIEKMRKLFYLLSVAFFFLAVLNISATSNILSSSEVCADYGFNPTTLVCSTCDLVGQILGDSSEAKKKCSECCLNIINTEEKYEKAVLEIDKRAIPFLPDLKAIIEKKKELKLTVRYKYGHPRLLMYKNGNEDEPSEVHSVHSWNQDTFKDYLMTHLTSLSSK
jgi:hypothetical protein